MFEVHINKKGWGARLSEHKGRQADVGVEEKRAVTPEGTGKEFAFKSKLNGKALIFDF